jgi:nucleotide-binding universal stress UspA family protein
VRARPGAFPHLPENRRPDSRHPLDFRHSPRCSPGDRRASRGADTDRRLRKSAAEEGFMIALKNILVPHDFSETSEAAMRYGIELARLFGAKLHIVHVGEKARFEMATEFPLGLDMSLEDAIRERLSKIMGNQEQLELKPTFLLLSGTPHVEIVRYASDHAINLIVMGTHGRGPVAHAVMGSVAERVVRYAPCPVLTVRHPELEFVMPFATEAEQVAGANT